MDRQEIFDKKLSNIEDSDLIERSYEEVHQLCKTRGRSITMSVPPSIYDTDMILCEMIRRYEQLLNNE